MRELKPCPFCGSDAYIQDDGGRFYAACTNVDCGCRYGEEWDCDDMPVHQFIAEPDAIAAWNARTEDYREALRFIGKWVERGLFCKTTSPHDALSVIAHLPNMPWNSERWDVDHKPYAEAFYKTFPKALGDAHD